MPEGLAGLRLDITKGEVVDVTADEAVDDAGELEFLVADGGMGGGSGVADERFHAAQADGVAGDFQVAEELKGRRFAAVATGSAAIAVAAAVAFAVTVVCNAVLFALTVVIFVST